MLKFSAALVIAEAAPCLEQLNVNQKKKKKGQNEKNKNNCTLDSCATIKMVPRS